MARRIEKVLLIQPNYAWLNKRTWRYPPYTLCLLKAALAGQREVNVFDPNFYNVNEEEVAQYLRETNPDLVGVTSISTEYFSAAKLLISIIRKACPEAIIVFGGVIPTVLIEESMRHTDADYWV